MELLVVIVIVAVLVSISATAVIKFRRSAGKVTMGNSLRQMQTANASYASDHNGKYLPVYETDDKGQMKMWPENKEFLAALFGDGHVFHPDGSVNLRIPEGFIEKSFVKGTPNPSLHDSFYGGPFGYAHDSEIAATGVGWGSKGSSGGTRMNKIKNPERTAAFALCSDWMFKYPDRLKYEDNPSLNVGGSALLFYYDNKVPVVFYDGHLAYISPQQIKQFDKEGGKNHPFWNAVAGQ